MNKEELRTEVIPKLEKIIQFSLKNNLDLHTCTGGKYGELWVASELWKHEPKLSHERSAVKGVEKPTGCDIILTRTKKKLEVKWGMLHHRGDDSFFKRTEEIPFWGWGFSSGKQFIDKKFDYCILLAAKKRWSTPSTYLRHQD